MAPDRPNHSRYVIFATVGILVAVLGFNVTYIQPVLLGARTLSPIYHLHGFFGAAWLLLFLGQSILILRRKIALHRQLGFLGAFAALGVVITMPLVGVEEVQRQIAIGRGNMDNVVGPFLDAVTFGMLVVAGDLDA